MPIRHLFTLLLLIIASTTCIAASPAVYERSGNMPIDETFDAIYQELEQRNFYVIFEANIGKNLSRFKDKWAENYNKNKLGGIRSLVFCNGWYANKVSNVDPAMLAICPLHLTVIERSGKAHILFVKPSVIGAESPAFPILKEIEETVIEAINAAIE